MFLPDLGRQRGALTRLLGLRLIHTHLGSDGLNQDDFNDLALLRLDLIAALIADAEGRPPEVEAAYLQPMTNGGDNIVRLRARHISDLAINFKQLIQSLEDEFSKSQRAVRDVHLKDRALLLSISATPRIEAEDRLIELEELARTAGIQVVDKLFFRPRSLKTKNVISEDRIRQLNILSLQTGVDLLIFDQNLSPAQIGRLAAQTELRIIDRTQLILDIFAQRAQTREGKLQVEVAQLNYILPRLIQKNTAMSRLTGGIGARGPGETKLEINRRRVRDRITRLNKELDQVKAQRGRHRARRSKAGLPIVSIVGYTNAGKSTLLNKLTQSDVFAENKLFATLDPTSRRLRFPRDKSIIITDTVGFIRDLPPDLVKAFSATLEELASADLLLHVIDASNPQAAQHVSTVEKQLNDLELSATPVLRVLNKIDKISAQTAEAMSERYQAVCVSALDPSTFPPLVKAVGEKLGWTDLMLDELWT